MVADCVAATVKFSSRNSYLCPNAKQKGLQELILRRSVKVSRRFEGSYFILKIQIKLTKLA